MLATVPPPTKSRDNIRWCAVCTSVVALLPATADPALSVENRALGKLIKARAKEIEQRWLERVSEEVAHRHVEPTQLRDGMPHYLRALASLLCGPEDGETGETSWARVARDHGITRVRVGFNIEQLVREFVTLRDVIERVAAEHGLASVVSSKSLADLVDAAITKSVSAYVDTRDYELRRRQAENIGFVIHELRNPLAAAVTATEVARVRVQGTQCEHAFETIERSHRRLTELIEGVLLTEKLESGSVKPRKQMVRLADLLDSSTAVARKLAIDRGLAFDVRGERDVTLSLDPDLTRSALQNLIDNAVKYTDEGRIEISVEDRGHEYALHVRDTCSGLSPEELRTIFEPFKRGATKKAGTGLGLAIARRAIEMQGGTIHAESTGHCGCHFWFTLPKA